jgi:hypothetical protein
MDYQSVRDLKRNCTLSYDLSNTFSTRAGGAVDEYCVLKDAPESDYRGQCCVWYYDE